MKVRGDNPKDIQHIATILESFSEDWKTRIKQRIKRSKLKEDKQYSRTELCEELSHKHDNYAGELVDMLVDVNVFEETGRKETASNTVEVYSFNSNWEKHLGQSLKKTEWWQEIRPIAKTIFQKGEGKEIV